MLSVNGVLLNVNKENVGKVVSKIKMAVTTTVSEVDIEKTCRICLMKNETEDLFCLFTQNKMFSDLTISTAILDCFGVSLKQEEDLPKYVCINCASSTLQAYTFKKCLLRCQGYLMKQQSKARFKAKMLKEISKNNIEQQMEVIFNPSEIELPDQQVEVIEVKKDEENLENTVSSEGILVNLIEYDHNYSKPTDEETSEILNNEEASEILNEEASEILNTEESVSNRKNSNVKKLKLINKKFMYKKGTEKLKTAMISRKTRLRSSGPPYECKICGKNFGVKFNAFYLHVRIHYIEKQQCEHCGKIFLRNKLQRHMRTHTNEKPYQCEFCPARFTLRGNLQRHLRSHTGEKLYICDICGKSLTQSSTLLSHRQRHLGEIRHVCAFCGKTFTSDNSYSAHIHTAHNKQKFQKPKDEILDELVIYPCELCGRVFNKAFSLRIHLRWHDYKKNFCNVCKKIFYLSGNFDVHNYWHEIEMLDLMVIPINCKFCNEEFAEKDAFLEHILTHMELLFTCKLCNKPFSSKASLKFHMRCHSNKKSFNCTLCYKQFKSSAGLRQHLKIHSGEKPYSCEHCLRRFTQQQQLDSHKLIHTGEKRYVCPFCNKAFTLNGNLTVHIRRHTGETPHYCNICGKGFFDTSSRKRHIEAKHPNGNEEIKMEKSDVDL